MKTFMCFVLCLVLGCGTTYLKTSTITVKVLDKEIKKEQFHAFSDDEYALVLTVEGKPDPEDTHRFIREGRPVVLTGIPFKDKVIFFGTDRDRLYSFFNQIKVGGTYDIVIDSKNNILEVKE
jgi:hypothetical protein